MIEYDLIEVTEAEWKKMPNRDRWIRHYENAVIVAVNQANRRNKYSKSVKSLWKKMSKVKVTKEEQSAFNAFKHRMEEISYVQDPQGIVHHYNDFHEIRNNGIEFKLSQDKDGYYTYKKVKHVG